MTQIGRPKERIMVVPNPEDAPVPVEPSKLPNEGEPEKAPEREKVTVPAGPQD